jgi:hypothetical protein
MGIIRPDDEAHDTASSSNIPSLARGYSSHAMARNQLNGFVEEPYDDASRESFAGDYEDDEYGEHRAHEDGDLEDELTKASRVIARAREEVEGLEGGRAQQDGDKETMYNSFVGRMKSMNPLGKKKKDGPPKPRVDLGGAPEGYYGKKKVEKDSYKSHCDKDEKKLDSMAREFEKMGF